MRPILAAVALLLTVGCGPSSPQEAAVAALPVGSCHARHVNPADPQAWEPDVACTPGATDGGLTFTQLCPVAHTDTVRPPSSYTSRLKVQQMRAYGFTDPVSAHEEDHLIPLSLGGSPRDPLNLWPEPHGSPNAKDRVENAAHDAVCTGRIELWDAQGRIATDWYGLGKYLTTLR
jgi:hypothetical protein